MICVLLCLFPILKVFRVMFFLFLLSFISCFFHFLFDYPQVFSLCFPFSSIFICVFCYSCIFLYVFFLFFLYFYLWFFFSLCILLVFFLFLLYYYLCFLSFSFFICLSVLICSLCSYYSHSYQTQ